LDSERGDLVERKLGPGEILVRLGQILLANAGFALACVAGLAAVNFLAGHVSSGLVTFLPGAIAAVVMHYYLIATALTRLGLRRAEAPNRFWDFWGLLILSGFIVLWGFVILIVPGLYLNARWAAAGSVLVSGDGQVGAALDQSWKMSGPSAWPIIATWLVIYVPMFLIGMTLAGILEIWLPIIAQPVSQVIRSSAVVLSWLVGVAVYSLLRPGTGHLAEIFA